MLANEQLWPLIHRVEVVHDTEFPTHSLLGLTIAADRGRTSVDKMKTWDI